MTLRDVVADYLNHGLFPVPLRPGGKELRDTGGLTHVYTPDDFNQQDNVGLVMRDHFIDVDLDCPESSDLAHLYLFPTASFGRASKVNSHYLYRGTLPQLVKYVDGITGAGLLEVRVKLHYCMAPPSVHPNGETLTWASEHLLNVDNDEAVDNLMRRVRCLCTCIMASRYYPAEGSRHHWCLAFAGLLRKRGVTETEAGQILKDAGARAGDTENRSSAVSNTYARNERDGLAGARRLLDLMPTEHGKRFLDTLRKVWPNEFDWVEEMNETNAFIARGRPYVIHEKGDDTSYVPYRDLGAIYPEKVQVGITARGVPIFKAKGQAWIEHAQRRECHGEELAPEGGRDGYYNHWKGWPVPAVEGAWDLYQEHIWHAVGENAENYWYVIQWLAQTVQHPGVPIGISLVFRGEQGTGKSTFASNFGQLFGKHFWHVDSDRGLTGQFNAHLAHAIVVLADEAVWAGHKGRGALKRLITEKTLSIERKGLDIITMPNLIHLIVCGNPEWLVPAEFDDRRFAIFETSTKKRNDAKFFGAVDTQLRGGGLSALLYYLQHYEGTIDLRKIPETQERWNQKLQSLDSDVRWWFDELWHADQQWWPEGLGEVLIDREQVYERKGQRMKMASWRNEHGFQIQLGKMLQRWMPSTYPRTMQHEGKRCWVFPTLAVCRAFFEDKVGSKVQWPDREPGEEG